MKSEACPDPNTIKPTIEEVVQSIQLGDEEMRCEFIHEHRSLIKKFVSKTCCRYVDHTMDEYSIGLAAFNEAINQFQARKASSFLSFAYVVVRRRVIDFLRKEASQRKVLFFGQLNSLEENIQEEASLPQLKRAIQFFEMRSQNEKLADEIYEYQKILEGYDISFNHLIKQCPKQIDARQRAVMIAKTIAENEELSVYLCKKKKLPLKDLLTKVPYSRKTIERHRSYIVALALVYIGRFTGLKSYTQFV